MNLMGKIILIMNFLMSVLFMMFSVAVMVTREDLRGQLKTENKKVADLTSKSAGLEEGNKVLTTRLESVNADLANRVKSLQDEVETVESKRTQLDRNIKKFQDDQERATAQMQNMTIEMEQRQKEVDELRKFRTDLINANAKLTTEKGELNDKISEQESQLGQINERNQQMANMLTQLEQWALRKNSGVMPSPIELEERGDGPPATPDVEGIVTAVDGGARFVSLSIGEDSGVRKGMVFEVYRTKPEPKYLGQVKIFESKATTSVAKPVGSVTGLIQPNDRVGPTILRTSGN